MTICPIAIVAGCKKCPAFKICPLKRVIGDMPSEPAAEAGAASTSHKGAARKKK